HRPAVRDQAQAVGGGQLDQATDAGGDAEDLQARAGILAGLEHLGRGLALGERQRLLDDHGPTQRHREQHAQQAAEAGDAQHPPVVEVGPVAHQHQGRDREDHAGGDRRAGRGTGLDDVVLQDRAAAEQAQHAHGDDRRRDGGGHGQAGEQAQVGVGRRQHHREHDGEDDGAEGQLWRTLAGHSVSPANKEAATLLVPAPAGPVVPGPERPRPPKRSADGQQAVRAGNHTVARATAGWRTPESERDVVVGKAVVEAARGRGRGSRRRGAALATAVFAARRGAALRTVAAAVVTTLAAATATAATEHLHLVGDDLGDVALLAILAGELVVADRAFDVALRTLAQVLAGDFAEL